MSKRIHELVLYVFVSFTVRGLYIFSFHNCGSYDLGCWDKVGNILMAGGNPYAATNYLNWAPVWMELIYLFKKISLAWHVPFSDVIRVFLIAVETLLVCVLHAFAVRFANPSRAARLLVVGIALNPISVFQVCQHCNFDVMVGFWILLAVYMLLRFQERHEFCYWLCACLALGIGAATKTVPLCLAPLLLLAARKLKWIELLLGAVALLGPIAFGVATLYVLAPDAIRSTILSYRGGQGAFGLSGLFLYFGWTHLLSAWTGVFEVIYGTAAACVGLWLFSKDKVEPGQLVSVAALMLIAIPAIGPGYGIQYVYWYLPLLLLLHELSGRGIRIFLWVMYAVAVAVYAVSYGFNFNSYGAFVLEIHQTGTLLEFARKVSIKSGETFLSLPLWLLYVTFTAYFGVGLGRVIFREFKSMRQKG